MLPKKTQYCPTKHNKTQKKNPSGLGFFNETQDFANPAKKVTKKPTFSKKKLMYLHMSFGLCPDI